MKFSTRTTYGLRAISRLVCLSAGETMSLAVIADEERISQAYLERIFARLKKDGIIRAVKGAQGGYRLARPAGQITVFEVVRALEGKLSLFHCVDEQGRISCGGKCQCGATKVLSAVQSAVHKSLRQLNLKDLR